MIPAVTLGDGSSTYFTVLDDYATPTTNFNTKKLWWRKNNNSSGARAVLLGEEEGGLCMRWLSWVAVGTALALDPTTPSRRDALSLAGGTVSSVLVQPEVGARAGQTLDQEALSKGPKKEPEQGGGRVAYVVDGRGETATMRWPRYEIVERLERLPEPENLLQRRQSSAAAPLPAASAAFMSEEAVVVEPLSMLKPRGGVVFLHGFGSTPASYRSTLRALAASGLRVVAPTAGVLSTLGVLDATGAAVEAALVAQGLRALECLKAEGLEASVIGHDLGAACALVLPSLTEAEIAAVVAWSPAASQLPNSTSNPYLNGDLSRVDQLFAAYRSKPRVSLVTATGDLVVNPIEVSRVYDAAAHSGLDVALSTVQTGASIGFQDRTLQPAVKKSSTTTTNPAVASSFFDSLKPVDAFSGLLDQVGAVQFLLAALFDFDLLDGLALEILRSYRLLGAVKKILTSKTYVAAKLANIQRERAQALFGDLDAQLDVAKLLAVSLLLGGRASSPKDRARPFRRAFPRDRPLRPDSVRSTSNDPDFLRLLDAAILENKLLPL